MNYKSILSFLLVLGALGTSFANAAPPIISYGGQVSVDGQPFTGTGLFKFAILNAENNATLWSNDGTSANGSQPSASVGIPVNGGLYSILLGNAAIQGMTGLNPNLFTQNNDTRLRIWFSDGQGFEQLSPDRQFTSVPYALSANIPLGSIGSELLSPAVRADLNRTITKSMLGADVLNDLNTTVSFPGSIIAVPEGQSPPSGYSLYRTAEPNPFVWYQASDIDIHKHGNGKTIGLNSKLYYLCGADSGSDPGKLCSVYDPNTDQWTPISPSNYTSDNPGAITHNGKIYLLNGKYLEIYDPVTDTWQVGPTMPTSESPEKFGYTKLNGKIWALGGYTGTSFTSNPYIFGYFYSFDLSTNTWQDESSSHNNDSKYFNDITDGLKILTYFDKIWVINPNGSVFSFDPDSKSWKFETVTPVNQISATWSTQGRLFISQTGAIGSTGRFTNIFIYDEFSKSWKEFGHLPKSSGYSNIAIVDERIFITGFNTGSFWGYNFFANLNDSFSNSTDLYIKDGNASAGVPAVQAEVADEHVTTNKLSDGSVTSAKIAHNSVDHPHLSPAVRADLNRTITKSMLGSDVLNDLNRTITKNMLSPTIQSELNASSSRPFGATILNPYGLRGNPVVSDGTPYTVPSGKILVITSSGLGATYNSKKILDEGGGPAILPAGTVVTGASGEGWSGILCNPESNIDPVVSDGTPYTVPSGKILVITSSGLGATYNSKKILDEGGGPAILPAGTVISGASGEGWSGYLKTQ